MAQASETGTVAAAETSRVELVVLTLLRVAVGWHFLYEGVVKLLTPGWSSAGYLQSSTGFLAGFFQWMAADPTALMAADLLNICGLVLVGSALMLGCLTRFAAACGIAMLALYYAAHPPLFGAGGGPAEGHYLVVNKNLVELLALAVILVRPAAEQWGLDRLRLAFWARFRGPKAQPATEAVTIPAPTAAERDPLGRRAVLASFTGVTFLGAFVLAVLKKHGWASHEEEQLAAKLAGGGAGTPQPPAKVDAVVSATIKEFKFQTLKDLKGQVPHTKIKDLELSRLILGGNLIGGWAHARDLIYVSTLVKAYHHKWKIFETFALAEKCGINAFLTNPVLCEVMNEYWKQNLGKIRFISDCGGSPKDLLPLVKKSIDNGAAACYVQGGTADRLVELKNLDLIAQALDLIRQNKCVAGIGAHRLSTVKACVEKGLKPDFWMKTVHHTRYWSATPKEQCDNIWCEQPPETIAFMEGLEQPWIGFKTLAAGAIHPRDGFRFALKGGADFLCVGMYDFQIVEDVNIFLAALAENQQRKRPWRA